MIPHSNLLRLASAVELGDVPSLSILQPYPNHIFYNRKDVENRSWRTDVRGWFLIHAGMSGGFCGENYERAYPRGGIVGFARITDCVRDMPNSSWFCGPYGFVLADATPLPLIPEKGKQGWFYVTQPTAYRVADAIRGLAAVQFQAEEEAAANG
jgi:hypothetical protein